MFTSKSQIDTIVILHARCGLIISNMSGVSYPNRLMSKTQHNIALTQNRVPAVCS